MDLPTYILITKWCKNIVITGLTFKNNHHSIAYHWCRESLTVGTSRFTNNVTENNLDGLFTRVMEF